MTPSPLYLAGPTGSGKSVVALALAERIPGAEIVSADAFQVYEGLDILTAKPSAEERARVPHHLFAIIPLSEEFSAAQFEQRARACIDAITRRGHLPIVTGGTGLYIKTLTHGLSPLPEADPALRAALDRLSPRQCVAWFERLDPDGAARTNLSNPRYVQRALEIILQSGRPVSALKTAWEENPRPAYRGIYLERQRDDLYARINRRTVAMIEAGLLDEVRALGDAPLSVTAGKAIGIREIRRHLAGETGLPACITAIQQATRRYAKRQGTWFKRERGFVRIAVAAEESPESVAERIMVISDQ